MIAASNRLEKSSSILLVNDDDVAAHEKLCTAVVENEITHSTGVKNVYLVAKHFYEQETGTVCIECVLFDAKSAFQFMCTEQIDQAFISSDISRRLYSLSEHAQKHSSDKTAPAKRCCRIQTEN